MKKYSIIIISAFLLNFIWENLHSFLYINYKGDFISEYILTRSAGVDAIFIFIIIIVVSKISFIKNKPLWIFVTGIILAIILELWALSIGRWAYSELMPIIPIIKTGLTPTIQLGLTGLIAYKLSIKY